MKVGDRVSLYRKVPYPSSSGREPKIQYYPKIGYIDNIKSINLNGGIILEKWFLGVEPDEMEAIFAGDEFDTFVHYR